MNVTTLQALATIKTHLKQVLNGSRKRYDIRKYTKIEEDLDTAFMNGLLDLDLSLPSALEVDKTVAPKKNAVKATHPDVVVENGAAIFKPKDDEPIFVDKKTIEAKTVKPASKKAEMTEDEKEIAARIAKAKADLHKLKGKPKVPETKKVAFKKVAAEVE